jgi:hypothetical protein
MRLGPWIQNMKVLESIFMLKSKKSIWKIFIRLQ